MTRLSPSLAVIFTPASRLMMYCRRGAGCQSTSCLAWVSRKMRKAIVGPQRQIELNRFDPRRRPSGRRAINQLALTRDRKFRTQGELRDAVPPLLRSRCLRADARLQLKAKTFKPADKRRSLRTEACQPEVESKFSPAASRNELRCDPQLCPDRVSRRPARPPTVARN
jgi:hypothetical protein